jgi:D-serine deaminase-like pyridoxal phosphate-dependent protein
LPAPGLPVQALDTPALVVDLDAMERNIARIAGFLREAGVAWRPHTKGLKVPAIAHRLLQAGAIGITCAKVSEAEVMASAGIPNILVANQVVGEHKMRRLAGLCRWADVMVAVDDAGNVRQIGQIARSAGVSIGVLVEVNVGMNRCGVDPGAPAVDLARLVHGTTGVKLRGLMGWEGHTMAIRDPEARAPAVIAAIGALTATAAQCRAAGLPVEIVSCGGTGTYRQSALQSGVTEVQAGGGVFGDVFYRDAGVDVEPALTVLATVTSRPAPDRVVTDAGRKAMSADAALPQPVGLRDVRRVRLSAEHGAIELEVPAELPRVGEKIAFTVGYADTTVFLHDYLYGIRGGTVEVVWPVLGRGKLQ